MKKKAVKVNLSTKAEDIMATFLEEEPKAAYFYRKGFGGTLKYQKYEDEMVERALANNEDQWSEPEYWISPVGNRWITYTHVTYYPRARYACAVHYSFIYYETMASCGAFFPMFSPKQQKDGKTKKKSKPDGILRYSDHFFLRLSTYTGVQYRSKELIRKFICERLEHAMTIDENNEVVVKLMGGHGFGKRYETKPQFIEVRTFLTDEKLSNSQKRKCKAVDDMHELTKNGMYIKEVALGTAFYSMDELKKDAPRQLEAIKNMGMEKKLMWVSVLSMIYTQLLERILHCKCGEQQMALISFLVGAASLSFLKKWENNEKTCEPGSEMERDFFNDIVEVMNAVARKMKLVTVTKGRIYDELQAMVKEGELKELKY